MSAFNGEMFEQILKAILDCPRHRRLHGSPLAA
jgi:hypothetical protein